MKEFKGTKGEWKTGRLDTEVTVGSKPILDVWSFDRSKEETIANFNLVKAAPELLEALNELVLLVDDITNGNYKPDSFTTQPAKIAINKALGE